MSEIAKAYVHVVPSASGIKGSLQSIFEGGEVSGAGVSIGKSLGGTIVKTVAALGIGKAVSSAISSTFNTGMGFDSAMSQVAATMNKSTEEITDLRNVAKEMGATTAFTATEAAEGLNYLALAGYSMEQQIAALPTVLNLASAGAMDLGAASDMVTDAISALGIEVTQENLEEFADKLARTSSISNTSVSQLGDAILTVGGTAKQMKGGTTELSAALGILADNGIKAAEGGTHLRNILLAMNPTTDKAVAAWDKLGVSAYDADGNLRPLQDTFAELSTALEGYSDQEKQDLLTKMFNKTDLAAIQAMLGTSTERWDELTTAIEESGGAAETMAATQLDNVEGSLTLMGSALDGLKLSLWDTFSNVAKGGIDLFTGAVGAAQGFVDEHSELIKGSIKTMATGIETAVGLAKSGFAGFVEEANTDGTTLNEITTLAKEGFDAVQTAVTTCATIGSEKVAWFKEQLETEGTPINTAVTAIGSVFTEVKGVMETVIGDAVSLIQSFTQENEDGESTISNAWNLIQSAVTTSATFVSWFINHCKETLENMGITSETVKGTIDTVFAGIKTTIDTQITIITGILDTVTKLLNGDFSGAWTTIQTTIDTVVGNIVGFLDEHTGLMKTWNDVTSAVTQLKSDITGTWQEIQDFIGNAVETVKGFFDFEWSFPTPKLPHFNVDWRDLGMISIPNVSIEWYAKAMNAGYLFTSPTVLGGRGFGDAGAEMVIGRDSMMGMISDAQDNGMQSVIYQFNKMFEIFEEYFPIFASNKTVRVNSKSFARDTSSDMYDEINSINAMKGW